MANVGVILAVGLAGCGDAAILVTISGDLTVSAQLDGVCLHIADADDGGGSFGRFYQLGEDLALPQSLAVEPGGASAARVTARGYHAGIEVVRAGADTNFSASVTLALDRCPGAPGGTPLVIDAAVADAGTRVAVSWGRGGSILVLVGPGGASALSARGGTLQPLTDAVPAASGTRPLLVAFDADGDCDDDLLVAPAGEAPVLWLREDGPRFSAATDSVSGMPPIVAAVSVDVDSDGDVDLVVGGGATLGVWRNDGTGRFVSDPAALAPGDLGDVTALAAGDIDGDGRADVVVGQGFASPAPAAVFFGDVSGSGFFVRSTAALPELPVMTRALALVDVTGDGRRDLLMVGESEPVRLYVNRGDGRLEDRSFVTLPDASPMSARSVAAGDWDGDCIVDAAIGRAAPDAPLLWRGSDGGPMVSESLPSVAGDQVVLADVDDDGDPDLIIVGAGEVTWLAR